MRGKRQKRFSISRLVLYAGRKKTKRVQQNKEGLRLFARAFFFMNTLQAAPGA